MSNEIKPIPNEKIEKLQEELNKLQEEATLDLVINFDMEKNFNNCEKMFKWVKHYNKWKHISSSAELEFKRIKSMKYFMIKESNIYTMTEKEIEKRLDGDLIIISYKNFLETLELIVAFIQKIQELLDNQRYDIKEKFAYMRYLNGEDF